MKKIKTGLIGVGKRGSYMMKTIAELIDGAEIHAICDGVAERAEEAAETIYQVTGEKPLVTTDYRDILRDSEVEAVVIMTGWEQHIRIATEAMRAGKYAAIEVGGAYSLEDCYTLVHTYEETGVPCMMLENCCYGKTELAVTNMVRMGLFGEVVHCSGGYHHDIRKEVLIDGKERNHYRYNNYRYRNCENYPTHELGPIAMLLNINRGNRMVTLTSTASKQKGIYRYIDEKCGAYPELKNVEFHQGDIVTTVIKCANGETITLTLDTTLPRYYSRGFTVHGTKGLYTEDNDSVFLEDVHTDEKLHLKWKPQWGNAEEYREKYLHPIWRKYGETAVQTNHDGIDYLVLSAFFESVAAKTQTPIDVYDAASWMCITCLSEESIQRGGIPVSIPDFTNGRWAAYKKAETGLEFSLD